MLPKILNFVGLLLITVGGIGAAFAAPQPQYGPDGSVGLAASPVKEKRVAMHKRQKLYPYLMTIVGIGAALQAIAIFL